MAKERVARALRAKLQDIGYGVGTINAGQLADALARAAIEAMREPTEDMISAGAGAEDAEFGVIGLNAATEAWRLMIDEALA